MTFKEWLKMNYEQQIIEHKQRLLNVLMYNGCPAELAKDLYQDMYIKVRITLETGKYFEEGKFKLWLEYVIKNMYMDYLRKKKRSKETPYLYIKGEHGEDINVVQETYSEGSIEDDIIEFEIDFRDKFQQDILISKVMEAQEKIHKTQKEMINLRVFKGMKFGEIADKLGISVSTALARMRYAKINIKKILET